MRPYRRMHRAACARHEIKYKGYIVKKNKSCKGVFGTIRTVAYRRYVRPVLPVLDTSASSVRHQYRYRTDIHTGTGHFGKFGTTSTPVSPVPVWTSVPVFVPALVQYRYRYRTLRCVQYNINPVPPHSDMKIWLIFIRSDSESQTLTFRPDEWIVLMQSGMSRTWQSSSTGYTVTIDTLDYEYTHDPRTSGPRLSASRLL